MIEHDYERAVDLVSVLPPDSRYMQALDPHNGWTNDLVLLSNIEHGIRMINHSVMFQHADKRSDPLRRELFPTDYIEPEFMRKERQGYIELEKKKKRERQQAYSKRTAMSPEELVARLSAPRAPLKPLKTNNTGSEEV